jgi:hypothetical protein
MRAGEVNNVGALLQSIKMLLHAVHQKDGWLLCYKEIR